MKISSSNTNASAMRSSSDSDAPVLGFCCICKALQRVGVSYKTTTYKRLSAFPIRDAPKIISDLIVNNMGVLRKILEWCVAQKIFHHRMSSSIFPLMSHPALRLRFDDLNAFGQIKKSLAQSGKFAKEHGISLSFHPGQYDVLASENPEVRKAAAFDVALHSDFMDLMRLPRSHLSPINLHVATRKDSPDFFENLAESLALCSDAARKRIVFENEDRGYWTVSALLKNISPMGFPVTFDFLHRKCNPCGLSERDAFFECAKTWGECTPVFHYAESASETNLRAHSDYILHAPPHFGKPYICEIEAKAKDDALLRIFENSQTFK